MLNDAVHTRCRQQKLQRHTFVYDNDNMNITHFGLAHNNNKYDSSSRLKFPTVSNLYRVPQEFTTVCGISENNTLLIIPM